MRAASARPFAGRPSVTRRCGGRCRAKRTGSSQTCGSVCPASSPTPARSLRPRARRTSCRGRRAPRPRPRAGSRATDRRRTRARWISPTSFGVSSMSCGSAPVGVRLCTSTDGAADLGRPRTASGIERGDHRAAAVRVGTSRSPRARRASSDHENDSHRQDWWTITILVIVCPVTWAEHATERLRAAGLRPGGAGQLVLGHLGEPAVLPRRAGDLRGARARSVGLASVYRMLDRLDEHGLVQRIDFGDGIVALRAGSRRRTTTISSAATAARSSRSPTRRSSRRSRPSRSEAAIRSSHTRSCCAGPARTAATDAVGSL